MLLLEEWGLLVGAGVPAFTIEAGELRIPAPGVESMAMALAANGVLQMQQVPIHFGKPIP